MTRSSVNRPQYRLGRAAERKPVATVAHRD
jgi:hypothetical protein